MIKQLKKGGLLVDVYVYFQKHIRWNCKTTYDFNFTNNSLVLLRILRNKSLFFLASLNYQLQFQN